MEEEEGKMKEEGSDGGGGWRWALPGMTGVSAVRSERQSWIHSCKTYKVKVRDIDTVWLRKA